MATIVKHMEKDFIIRSAIKDGSSVHFRLGNKEHNLHLLDCDNDRIFVSHNLPSELMKKGTEYNFYFYLRGQIIAFKAKILESNDKALVLTMPEKIIKNLSRRYARLAPPPDMTASFSFAGVRYDLDFPSSNVDKPNQEPEPSEIFNPADIRALVADFERKANLVASERRINLYKEKKPEGAIESLTSETGLSFFFPSHSYGIPKNDPFGKRTIITREDFEGWFLASGMSEEQAEMERVQLERNLRNEGIRSMLVVPILFQHYSIGNVQLVNKDISKKHFDLKTVETFTAFSRVLSWSLHLHGYFKDTPRLDDNYRLQIVDISAGGLLFVCKDARIHQVLKEGIEVMVRLVANSRTIDASGTILRHFSGKEDVFFGIEFSSMSPEDFRFLFEYLYGRPFRNEDSDSIEGMRIGRP